MASKRIEDLTPEVQRPLSQALAYCITNGVNVLIYCTLRDLQEQARLYRQSRSWAEIKAKIDKFHQRGFHYLAEALEGVGAVPGILGQHVTMAAPGESWHNYREAFDGVPLKDGKPQWNDLKSYEIYGKALRSVGLIWAGDWVSFKELPHGQFRPGGNPLKTFQPDQIENILRNNGLI